MKIVIGLVMIAAVLGCGKGRYGTGREGTAPAVAANGAEPAPGAIPHVVVSATPVGAGSFLGFDRNGYPGDERLAGLRERFSFVGYWLTNPPGAASNGWMGKRGKLVDAGFGFLVLANGRLEAQLGRGAGALGMRDGAAAVAAAKREGFPAGTIVFLDQEEGGRLTAEQAAYFLGWTEAVAGSAYKAGAYVSGQASPDGPGATITTAEDVREHVTREHRHPVALWVAQDTCGPSPGCVVPGPALSASGTADAVAWQYAQSPRRPDRTTSCVTTYAADGNCYGGASTDLFLDLDVAGSADPSHGR